MEGSLVMEIELCEEDSCWCAPELAQTKIPILLSPKTVDSILKATMTPAIFWEIVHACEDSVTPHPRQTNLNAMDFPTTISVPVGVHP
jgi:hypothetical protein